MSECVHLRGCVFFSDKGPGYSPELHEAMIARYCRGDSSDCARLLAMECVPRDAVPADLLPTDLDRLAEICEGASMPTPRPGAG